MTVTRKYELFLLWNLGFFFSSHSPLHIKPQWNSEVWMSSLAPVLMFWLKTIDTTLHSNRTVTTGSRPIKVYKFIYSLTPLGVRSIDLTFTDMPFLISTIFTSFIYNNWVIYITQKILNLHALQNQSTECMLWVWAGTGHTPDQKTLRLANSRCALTSHSISETKIAVEPPSSISPLLINKHFPPSFAASSIMILPWPRV